ncbi:hypothetical protein Dda_8338 [Drechslerella dactyloides]|uniref:Uncharacterized protein n=1 Tax=Drechslerella dactyloides TaxID=74499 RepID=A0AAD6IQI4_DREDA|nr:hypothetical protein Dda_8338 [Drechslerella dactyloides]
MPSLTTHVALLGLLCLLFHARPTLAFGAGNVAGVSKVEGVNWRHGDIEDTLLTILLARGVGGKKFDKLTVARVYFGNWLRDYSQAIDVGTVKAVSAEAIRLLLCILGFMTFGYGSKEFEVTADRLGCYRPEDHIDNPKNYADNVDARQYDKRLRGPIDERVELAIDQATGMKNYIANEGCNIMTSAQHVRNLFGRCIELGRQYIRNKNAADFHEALRLLGTGLHCLEDFLAHSNYTELALIELGEKDVFPHVGSRTRMRLQGARGDVFPLVTGTFGGVDFLHSVTGEVSDKLTQNEIEELEGTLQNTSKNDDSVIENLLDSIPDGLFNKGDKKNKMHDIESNAANSQMQNMSVSPRDPEEFTKYVQQVFAQIMPAIEFHDDLIKGISEAIDKLPILPKILEQLEERMSIWTFSIMAPFVVPIIKQVKNELRTGSNEIIESSKNEQHIVFEDDNCTDPTHSMLSKDHFSNVLNEVAGKTASKVVAWVVPQIMSAWDDEGTDVNRLMDRIIRGVLHHPAQRDEGDNEAKEGRRIMFSSIEEWWSQMDRGQKDEYRRKLSRRGVENGENHKEGVHDSGHGCGKPLGMRKNFSGGGTLEDRVASAAADAIVGGVAGGISDFVKAQTGIDLPDANKGGRGGGKYANEVSHAESGGIGGLLGTIGSSILGGFSGDEKHASTSKRHDKDSYTESRTEYGQSGGHSGKAEYSRTKYSGGGETESYTRYDQNEDRRGNTSSYQRTETHQTCGSGGSGYERTERYESSQSYGSGRHESSGGSYGSGRDDSYGGRTSDSYGGRDTESYGGRTADSYGGRTSDSYGGRDTESYGGRTTESYGGRNTDSYGGRQDDDSYGSRGNQSYGSRRDDNEYGSGGTQSHGRRQDNEYGSTTQSYGSRRDDEYGSRRTEDYSGSGNYGSRDDNESGSRGNYGSRRDDNQYGGGDSESRGYGGSYGGDGSEEHRGKKKHHKKDDDDDERRGGYGY